MSVPLNNTIKVQRLML